MFEAPLLAPPVSEDDATLRRLLAAAGALLRGHEGAVAAERKADDTDVTVADRAAEALLVDGLRRAFPTDAITAEEGTALPGGPASWWVDPLDGTSAFVEGLGTWGSTLARHADGRVLLGAIALHRVGVYAFTDATGQAWVNGHVLPPLAGSRSRRDTPIFLPSRLHLAVRLRWPGKARAVGSTAAHLLHVARGAGLALVGPGWAPWDTAAGLALVSAVGGEARLLDGTPLGATDTSGAPFVAGPPRLVARFLDAGTLDAWPDGPSPSDSPPRPGPPDGHVPHPRR
jgi:fructose-1,6-bisphosphatase/inositol monophosphatase family enzyme